MRKITCLLLLIQSGFMMAQTKTVVTPNGEKVTIHPSAPGTADNGLTITDYNVQLGGALVQPSILTTSSTNTLAVKGLQTGAKADEIVTMDADGVLRKIVNNSWDINGNTGTTAGTNFIGTTDDVDLVFKMSNIPSGKISGNNTSFGYNSMSQSTGGANVAYGDISLHENINGSGNTAIGSSTLNMNVSGSGNVAVGQGSLFSHVNSYYNTALGANTLSYLTSGDSNTVVGNYAGMSFGIGPSLNKELRSLSTSILIGYETRPLANGDENEIVIGASAVGRGSNTVQIGDINMTSIGGAVNWSIGSDLRLKKDIVTSTYGLNFISKLRPVTYKMKTGPTGLQSGFIAQEVEAAANGIGYEFNGIVKPQNESDFYSLRYSEFVVPLVKAVQEQQSQIESLQKQLENKDAKILEFEKRLLLLEQKMK